MQTTLTVSRHASKRWQERFPEQGLVGLRQALERATRVTFGRLLRWAAACGDGTHWRSNMDHAHDQVTQAMFVIDPERNTVVTVFRYKKPTKKKIKKLTKTRRVNTRPC